MRLSLRIPWPWVTATRRNPETREREAFHSDDLMWQGMALGQGGRDDTELFVLSVGVTDNDDAHEASTRESSRSARARRG
jgi:hypothetical protein